MAGAVALTGWLLAGVGVIVALIGRRVRSARAEAVARACHELRGPLTCASLGLELGIRAGQLSGARIRAIELELQQAVLALEDLGVAAGRCMVAPAFAEVDVRQLVLDSVEGWRAYALARGTRVSVSWSAGGARVWGDAVRLAQATGNLIANAIEHGGGTIEVIGRSDRGGLRLEVVDDGPGLASPVSELAGRPRGGHGLRGRGLAIATAIAEAHGGRLAAAPTRQGARVVLTLPEAHTHVRAPA